MNRDYGAGFQQVDFAGDTEGARKRINAWVEKQTRDKIKELFKEGVLNVDTRLVLANAIYFKGEWEHRFKKDRTHDRAFKVSATETVKVPMMHQTEDFKYAEHRDLQVLEMPYRGSSLVMTILLPKKVDGLAKMEKEMDSEKLATWLKPLRKRKVEVAVPKFKMTSEFVLNEPLQKMGIKTAFTKEADFTGLSPRGEELFIQAVVHKAFVEVNEEGTEAAAATGVAVGTTSVPILPSFITDHPFIFMIRDTRLDSILFVGRVVNPK